jgi:hypothetical protein
MRRINWKTVSTLVTMAALVGCQETMVAPIAPDNAPTSIRLAPEGRPSLSLSGGNTDNSESDFTVGAKGGLFYVGNHAVFFPAGSICDPSASGYSYGVGSWDQSCTPLKKKISIHAVTRTVDGKAAIDFTPSLRFVPSNNPARWVWLYMSTPSAKNEISAQGLDKYNILYAPTLGAAGIDESISDPTLRTYVDTRNGSSLRRIKHFSGYAVHGFTCSDDCPASEQY